MLKEFAISVVSDLRQQGHQAYLVGGCVRDLLLGHEPADYDISTSATPAEVMQIFPQTYDVGSRFGVVLVPSKENSSDVVEVATFRSDLGYTDGRRPDEVRFTTDPREDVQRRDFTINGMMLDPVANQVLDYVGGQTDLQHGVVRAIGNPGQRFAEDKLRMMRAVRLAARFKFALEPSTMAAIRHQASQINQVSPERLRDELTKMLTEGQAKRAFLLLDETDLLKQVLPEIAAMKGVAQPPEFHPEGDVFVHTLLLLDKLPQPTPSTLAWGALLHDVGKPATFRVAPDRIRFDGHVEVGEKMAEEICRRFRFSGDDAKQVVALIKNHMRFADAKRMKDSTFKRFIRLPDFDQHLDLHRLDCLASFGGLGSYDFVRERMRSLPAEAIRPAPLVNGDDLIALGLSPSPRFKEILSSIEDEQLDGRLHDREEALRWASQKFNL